MTQKYVKIQTKSVKFIGTLIFKLFIMFLQHCVISSKYSILNATIIRTFEHKISRSSQ
jgi:hypothetical protein